MTDVQEIEFLRLSDLPQLVGEVARFHAFQTGDSSEDGLEMRRAAFQKLALDGEEEEALLAVIPDGERAGDIVGLVVLVKEELEAFDDIGPWLTGLLTDKELSDSDLANRLVGQLEEIAMEFGYGQLFVQTVSTEAYKARGYAKIEPFDRDGVEYWVLGKAL